MDSAEERFASLVETMTELPGVTHPAAGDLTSKGFGSTALKVKNKIFAMYTGGRLVVKLSRPRVLELIAEGEGVPFESGGRSMKEWLALAPDSRLDWTKLATEAHAYVGGSS